MYLKLGLTRNIIRPHYALITPDGLVASTLPGWSGTAALHRSSRPSCSHARHPFSR